MSEVKAPVRNPIKPGEGAPKSATPAVAPVAAVAKPAQTLRSVQTARVPADRFKPCGHFTEDRQVMMRPDWDFADVLNPDFWSIVAPSMQANASLGARHDHVGNVIEILSPDHAYYGRVYVKGLKKNSQGVADGLFVECIGPSFDPETGKMCPVDLKTGLPWKGRKTVE